MSTYLDRPVFPLPIDWSDTPAEAFSCDLREIQLAFAAPRFQRLQPATARGVEFSLWLDNEDEVIAFETFVDSLLGRCNGFWLPSPFATARIVEIEDTTHIIVERQGWPDIAETEAGDYLVFTALPPGEADQYAHATTIETLDDGRDRVTLEAAVTVDATWECRRLLYVRFAGDDFDFEHVADNRARVSLRTLELTQEYAAIESGQRPVYLYELWLDTPTPVYWRFTGLNQNIVSSGQAFTSMPIEHSGQTQSLRHGESALTLQMVYETGNPLARFFPFNLPRTLGIRIYETTFAAPDTVTTIFCGRVMSVSLQGQLIKAECQTLLAAIGRSFPRFLIQPRCNYYLFSPCCRVVKTTFRFAAVINELGVYNLALREAAVPGGWPSELTPGPSEANWLALGWLETGAGETLEIRTIESSTAVVDGYLEVTLNAPLRLAAVDQAVTLYAGCDGAGATCKAKFDNFINWGGHVVAPANLTLTALEAELAQGANKK
jgi:hypothetical protein